MCDISVLRLDSYIMSDELENSSQETTRLSKRTVRVVLFWVLLGLAAIALPIVGAVKATNGIYYRYPVVGSRLERPASQTNE